MASAPGSCDRIRCRIALLGNGARYSRSAHRIERGHGLSNVRKFSDTTHQARASGETGRAKSGSVLGFALQRGGLSRPRDDPQFNQQSVLRKESDMMRSDFRAKDGLLVRDAS